MSELQAYQKCTLSLNQCMFLCKRAYFCMENSTILDSGLVACFVFVSIRPKGKERKGKEGRFVRFVRLA